MQRSSCGTPGKGALIVALLISQPALTSAQQRPSYLPNPKLTPGATVKIGKDSLCAGSETVDGSLSISLKRKVFELYGMRTESAVPHNIDHLIPVSLGGSNAIENLWPQPLSGEWSYSQKNKLERRLRKLVCSGELDLETAQREISTDWVSAFKKYMGKPRRQRGRAGIDRRNRFEK